MTLFTEMLPIYFASINISKKVMVPAYPKQHIYVPNSFLIHDCYASKIMNFDPYTFICVLSP